MSVPLRVLIVTDSFPPKCGGSGWSTWELSRGLLSRGHHVEVVKFEAGDRTGVFDRTYEGLKITDFCRQTVNVPVVRNVLKNERLWSTATEYLTGRLQSGDFDIVHAQHVLTTVPSIRAGSQSGTPVVATVRDYWPVCYWSDLIYTRSGTSLCPACSAEMMTRCIRPRGGVLWPLALPMIPYMRGNLARKRSGLAAADAIIAVSTTIAADLRARAPEIAGTRLEIIPNPVDVPGLRARAAATPPPVQGPYALYLGKLAPNKGTSSLVEVAERARLDWPLVIVGDGPERAAIEAQAKRSERDIRFTGWVAQAQTTTWLAHASLLVFTSRGPESLSRVLLEASALGVPIAAMNTGGTPDIVKHEETGLLSSTPKALAADVRRLVDDPTRRRQLGDAARDHAAHTFAANTVVQRVESLYMDLLSSAKMRAR